MEYLVTIVGYLDEAKRPASFPPTLRQVYNFKTESKKELVEMVSDATRMIVAVQGMLVHDDPDHLDLTKLDTNRMWVPMHMITHIRAEVVEVAQESPMMIEGKLQNKDGTEAKVN